MVKKIFTRNRVLLLFGAVGVVLLWKVLTVEAPRFDRFFEPTENVLLQIDENNEDIDYEGDNTILTKIALSETKPVVLSAFTIVAHRKAMRYILNFGLSFDMYQYHPRDPSVLEPLAKGVKGIFNEERLLKNDLNGLMFTTSFSSLENETITEEMRTIKPGYRLAVKLNPELCPGFFYLASQEKGPLCQIRGEVKKD